jgi:signal peptidase I
MADDNIQQTPPATHATGPATSDNRVSATPLPSAPQPAGGAASGTAFVPDWLSANLKYVGVGLVAGAVTALALKLGADLTTTQVAAIAVIVALAAGLAARAWLAPAPPRPKTADGLDIRSDASNTREVIETVVFVVVLVLLLKSFVAEAFVIPTGSMATTLYGYQKQVKCPECDYFFPVNSSQEVDPQDSRPEVIESCTCPNCRLPIKLAERVQVRGRAPDDGLRRMDHEELRPLPKYPPHTGDRVLVGKFLYDLPWNSPEQHRLNVVVFKYPREPQKQFTPLNYIKRLVGLPGETIAIYYGKIYVLSPDKGLKYDDSGVNPLNLWEYEHMHVDDEQALERWRKHEFTILRRPPDVLLAMRRIVYDNDHPARDLPNVQRWKSLGAGEAWVEDANAHTFAHAAGGGTGLNWLRYHHIIGRDGRMAPELITDFMGYNSFTTQSQPDAQPAPHWVGDLMIDCEVNIDKAEGQLVLELSRGRQRFRAEFNLASGDCTLKQIRNHSEKDTPADEAGDQLAVQPTGLKKPGTYHVRFANVDDRLLLWVDHAMPFGDGVPYTPAEQRGPTANDLEPAGIGVRGGGVRVGRLQLWRDTYYTQMHGSSGREDYNPPDSWSNPARWDSLQDQKPMTLYVQPGHYLCLGDNSPHSSDGRAWGLVPERLMLGRALVVYYPFWAPVWPFDSPVNRVGPIH